MDEESPPDSFRSINTDQLRHLHELSTPRQCPHGRPLWQRRKARRRHIELGQALIERGLRNNTDLGRAHLQVEQAEASLSAANLAFLPSFALAPQATISGVDGAAPSQTYRLPLTASWQLDVFGSLRNARQRARTLLMASQAYRQAVQAQVVSGIATYYYTLAMLDEQLKISEETAANWQKNVETMRALMAAGRYNDAAVSQSEANWYSVSASVLSLRQQIRETENRLAVLLGDSIHAVERGEMDAWQMPASLSVGLPASLLAQRPDVMRAESGRRFLCD